MIIKKRLIFWLLKAYIKRWGKIILFSFFAGLGVFFLMQTFLFRFLVQFHPQKKEVIGIVGSYTVNALPQTILTTISHGLTQTKEDGSVTPDIAQSWNILDGGKTYKIILKKNQHFIDGTVLNAQTLPLSFANVTIDKPNQQTLIFHLQDPYAPFLVTLSRPLFKDGFVGIGNEKVTHVTTDGDFVDNISLFNTVNKTATTYQFYPTEDALKVAFALGEITMAKGLTSLHFQNTSMNTFPNVKITKATNYGQMVALFYNTQDKTVSDKRIRDALSYALPNTFADGERALGPLPPTSWAYQVSIPHAYDLTHAKLLLEAVNGSTTNTTIPKLTITTQDKYTSLALSIQKYWKALGVDTSIEIVPDVPSSFQIYLGDYSVPKDPDQYTLWHSLQGNNIAHFSSQRIDKLLEEGRKTIDIQTRLQIYQDFQKYLEDEQPATFLYFPYSYTITRE